MKRTLLQPTIIYKVIILLILLSLTNIRCEKHEEEIEDFQQHHAKLHDIKTFSSSNFEEIQAEQNLTLREWPWISWMFGPPCPKRHHRQLLPVNTNSTILQLALLNARIAAELQLEELKKQNIYAGVSVGIVYKDQILMAEGFGQKNKSTTESPTSKTIYDIGSVTKIFTSLALYQTIDQGKCSLDSKVTDYYNEVTPPIFAINNPYSKIDGANAVTFRSLATQSSGLPREPYCGLYPLKRECFNETEEEILNINALSKLGLLFSPMTGAHYSNLGLALLGRSLQRVWGEKYETYMEQNIFKVLNMTSTGFNYSTEESRENIATGYYCYPLKNGSYYMVDSKYNTRSLKWANPCGGMHASTDDMMKFFMYLFSNSNNDNSEILMSKVALDSYMTGSNPLADGISMYGSGTWEQAYANGYWTLTKGGLVQAMAASIAIVPELQIGVSVMINVNGGAVTDKINAQIMSNIVKGIELYLHLHQSPLPLPSDYHNWLGNYGYRNDSVLVSMNDDDASLLEFGVLQGMVLGLGSVYFIWDPAQDYEGSVAFRYSATQETYISCLTLTGLGNNAIAYFTLNSDSLPVVTLADENLSAYFIPQL